MVFNDDQSPVLQSLSSSSTQPIFDCPTYSALVPSSQRRTIAGVSLPAEALENSPEMDAIMRNTMEIDVVIGVDIAISRVVKSIGAGGYEYVIAFQ